MATHHKSSGANSARAARIAAMNDGDLYETSDEKYTDAFKIRQHVARRAGLDVDSVPPLEYITKASHPDAYAAARTLGYLVNEERQAETRAQKAKRDAFLGEYDKARPARGFL